LRESFWDAAGAARVRPRLQLFTVVAEEVGLSLRVVLVGAGVLEPRLHVVPIKSRLERWYSITLRVANLTPTMPGPFVSLGRSTFQS